MEVAMRLYLLCLVFWGTDIGFTKDVHGHPRSLLRRVASVQALGKRSSEHLFQKRMRRHSDPDAKIVSMEPTSGQQLGEILRIQGENFGHLNSNFDITVGSTPCNCTEEIAKNFNGTYCHNDTTIVCVYQNATETIGKAVPIRVSAEGGQHVFTSPLQYTFLENAQVIGIHPRKTIKSGGTRVTVTGEHFQNAPYMIFNLFTVFNTVNRTIQSNPCDIINDTLAICTTPRPDLPKLSGTRKKRQTLITTCLNSDNVLDVHISLYIGRVIHNVKQGEENEMCVTEDPVLEEFKEDRYDFKRYEGQTEVQLNGDRLNYGIAIEDYEVLVGLTPCNITRLEANVLFFNPPLTVPDDLGEHQKNGDALVSVKIGKNKGEFAAGYLHYQFTKPVDWPPIVVGVVGGISCLLLIAAVVVYKRRRPNYKQPPFDVVDDYQKLIPEEGSVLDLLDEDLRLRIRDCWLSPDCLKREKEIGSGHYGKVFMGRISAKKGGLTKEKPVAIKTIKDEGVTPNQLKEFLEEATLMKDLKHKNIVNLVGVVIDGNKPYVVLPYMENGDLKSYISSPKNKFKVVDLIRLCIQVADGMTFISEQKIVHRDLRAVNCLVDHKITVKVADFGLSRDIYQGDYYTVKDQQRPLPIKWMSIETLEGHPFSTRSDVWSYGVLMWEVFTRGLRPYADVENNYDVLKQYLRNGKRLERPQFCTHDVYAVMMSCWERDPYKRKTFKELSIVLNDLIGQKTTASEPTITRSMPPSQDEIEKKDIDGGYFAPRSSTNEYIKKPGVINDYLTLLSEEGVPNASAEATAVQSGDEPREPSQSIPHHYENRDTEQDGYLEPSSSRYENFTEGKDMFVPSLDEALAMEGQIVQKGSGGSNPYFVNPPISDSYMTPEGKEKLAFSANPPRGDLYQTREAKYENTQSGALKSNNKDEQEKDAEYENAIDAQKISPDYGTEEEEEEQQQVKTYENVEKGLGKLASDTDVSYVTEEVPKNDSAEKPYANQQTSRIATPSQEHSEENVNLDFKSLVSKFGGKEKTKDYVNQPAHYKRKQNT